VAEQAVREMTTFLNLKTPNENYIQKQGQRKDKRHAKTKPSKKRPFQQQG
jgi:hypothetical protein